MAKCREDETFESDIESIEYLAEMFRCCVCLDKLTDASICPHCSKLFCFGCIQKWLTIDAKEQCPYCRARLDINEVVKCRWGQEVIEKLDSWRIFNKKVTVKKCDRHGEKLSVFCEACDICICHQCALWTGEHHSHVFRPVDEVYNEHMKHVNELIGELRKRHCEIIGSMQSIRRNIDNVQRAKEQRVREMRTAVEEMIAHLEAQLKGKLESLQSQRKDLESESEKLDTFLKEYERQKKTYSKSEMVERSTEIKEDLQTFLSSNQPKLETVSVSTDFQSEIVPSYDVGIFKVKPFSQKRKRAAPVFSDVMQAAGLAWRLKVYPDGNGVVRGNYLSVFLELHSGFQESSKYEYKIELLHPHYQHDPSRNVVREFASDFEQGECWGYNRFYRLELLASENFLNEVDDSITLRFQVRSPNYYQKCRDLEAYIKQLENTTSKLRMELTSLRDENEKNSKTNNEREVATGWNCAGSDFSEFGLEDEDESEGSVRGPSAEDRMIEMQKTMDMVRMTAELAENAVANEEDAARVREDHNDDQLEEFPLEDSVLESSSDCVETARLPEVFYSAIGFEREGERSDSEEERREEGVDSLEDVQAFLQTIVQNPRMNEFYGCSRLKQSEGKDGSE